MVPRARSTPVRPLLIFALALLACLVAVLAWRAGAAPAKQAHGSAAGACAAARRAHASAHACPSRSAHKRSTRAHRKAKARHTSRRHPSKAGAAGSGASSGSPASAAPEPARCEDGSLPKRSASGSFTCADDSEPECTSGAEPQLSPRKTQLLCPASAGEEVEWNEGCAAGSSSGSSASYACEAGSPSQCEDGAAPVSSDEGALLACPGAVSEDPSAGEASEGG